MLPIESPRPANNTEVWDTLSFPGAAPDINEQHIINNILSATILDAILTRTIASVVSIDHCAWSQNLSESGSIYPVSSSPLLPPSLPLPVTLAAGLPTTLRCKPWFYTYRGNRLIFSYVWPIIPWRDTDWHRIDQCKILNYLRWFSKTWLKEIVAGNAAIWAWRKWSLRYLIWRMICWKFNTTVRKINVRFKRLTWSKLLIQIHYPPCQFEC